MCPPSLNHAAKNGSKTSVKRFLAISILFKNLFKLLNLYVKKSHNATYRIGTEN